MGAWQQLVKGEGSSCVLSEPCSSQTLPHLLTLLILLNLFLFFLTPLSSEALLTFTNLTTAHNLTIYNVQV